ncbi:hypothetical protein K7432_002692 [Basidiobolus ranarum]|uniref:UspA domain-containing protein n=1 Tax=Basidiobolus ranarum TaxID=34480 RepID=A0ABR2W7D0_9FUNG
MGRIVVAFDNTKYSRNALLWTIDNVYRPEHQVTLLTVGVFSYKFGELGSNSPETAQYQNSWVNQDGQKPAEIKAKQEADEILAQGIVWLNEQLGQKNIKIHCHAVALTGVDPRTRIVDYVSSQDTYMLVVGDRGLNAMQRLVLLIQTLNCWYME